MSELTKQALKVENNTNFPNNNTGYITPALLREFNTDMIDSTVNQGVYNTDSGSWNKSIDSLNQFTASASGLTTGSLLITASATQNVITFTKGNGSTFNVTVADTTNLTPLNDFTASQLTKDATLATYTSSVNNSLTSINAFTSSQTTKDATLQTYTASVDQKFSNIGSQSGSWITESETASFAKTDVSNTFTQPNTFTSISASSFVSASEFVGNGSKLTGLTASVSLPILDEGIPQGNAVSMNFTGSGISAVIVGGTAIVSVNTPDSGTVNNLTASFNAYTSSTDAKFVAVGASTASLNAFTASFSTSSLVSTASFNQYTQSNDQKWTNLGGQSGSWITESETGSFAYINKSNNWSANQTFTNISAVSASFQYVQTLFETSSVIYSSGSNQLGDAIADIQTIIGQTNVSGSLNVTGSFRNNALLYPTTDGTFTGQVIQTNAAGVLSFGNVNAVFENIRNGEATTITVGTPLYVSGALGDQPICYRANAGDPTKMPVTFVAMESIAAGAAGRGITLGLITGINLTGYPVGTALYTDGLGQLTNVRPTGSNDIIQPIGIVTKTGNGGQLNVLNPGPVLMPNMQTGYMFVGDGTNQPVLIPTGSFVKENETGSFATTGSNTFIGDEQVVGIVQASDANVGLQGFAPTVFQGVGTTAVAYDQFVNGGNYDALHVESQLNNGTIFQDFNGTALNTWMQIPANAGSNPAPRLVRGLEVTGSTNIQNLTASLQQGYVWVGAANGKTTTVATSSFGGGGSTDITSLNAFTASQLLLNPTFATTGSNSFVGNQTVTGSIKAFAAGGGLDIIAGTYDTDFLGVALNLYANKSIAEVQMGGNERAQIEMYANGGNYDTFKVTVDSGSNGTQFQDYPDASAYTTWMQVGTSTLASLGEVTLYRNTNISGNLDIQSTITASLQQGYVLVGGANGRTTTVATSSFGGGGGFPYTGNAVITGSLGISGSMFGGVVALSVVGATASVDFSQANMFTLTLPSASTHILPTNVRAGQTVNIQITQPTPGTGSVTFPSAVKFAGGNDYQATTTGSAIDMLTLVSYDGSNVLGTSIKNFL